jgi:hypothetical protein
LCRSLGSSSRRLHSVTIHASLVLDYSLAYPTSFGGVSSYDVICRVVSTSLLRLSSVASSKYRVVLSFILRGPEPSVDYSKQWSHGSGCTGKPPLAQYSDESGGKRNGQTGLKDSFKTWMMVVAALVHWGKTGLRSAGGVERDVADNRKHGVTGLGEMQLKLSLIVDNVSGCDGGKQTPRGFKSIPRPLREGEYTRRIRCPNLHRVSSRSRGHGRVGTRTRRKCCWSVQGGVGWKCLERLV